MPHISLLNLVTIETKLTYIWWIAMDLLNDDCFIYIYIDLLEYWWTILKVRLVMILGNISSPFNT